MRHPELSMRSLVPVNRTARRVALAGVLLALALLIQGGGMPHVAVHPHLPRLALLAAAGPVIQLHIAAALFALVVGTVLLRGRKGTARHKSLGWSWVVAMATVVASSFLIRTSGHFSVIHALSGYVAVMLVLGVYAARRGRVARHRAVMSGIFVGGLIVAGLFTFVPGRLMYAVFLG